MIRKALLVGTTLGLATIFSMGISNAQDQQAPAPDRKTERSNRNLGNTDCAPGEDCGVNRDNRRERRARSGNQNNEDATGNQDNDDSRRARSRDRDDDDRRAGRGGDDDRDSMRQRDRRDRREARNWRYDPNHHRRSRHRDSTFRFYFGGYYYPERYWDGPVIVIGGDRVSCREGRDIVRDRGFNRVRTVECEGRNYTYTGRRQGETFRVVINSRTGRVVSVRAL